jgi:hypothetical protein
MYVILSQAGALAMPGAVPQAILHLVDALLDGVHRMHSVLYTQRRQQRLKQVVHGTLTDAELDHEASQQEIGFVVERMPGMAGIERTIDGAGGMIVGRKGSARGGEALHAETGGVLLVRVPRIGGRCIGHGEVIGGVGGMVAARGIVVRSDGNSTLSIVDAVWLWGSQVGVRAAPRMVNGVVVADMRGPCAVVAVSPKANRAVKRLESRSRHDCGKAVTDGSDISRSDV